MSPASAVEVLERIYACRCLPPSRLARLAEHLVFHAFQDGDTVVRAATPADTWHIVVSGRARLVDRHQAASAWPAVFGVGDGFGERGLIESGHWPGTVRADGPVTVASVSRGAFEAFTAGLEPGERAVFLQRTAWQADFDFLRRMNLFAHLGPADTERLFDRLDRIAVPRGDYLFHENAAADFGYIVRHGRLRLLTTAGHSRRQLAVRRDGELVGEIELLYGTPRMADAIADTDCEVFALSRTLFEELTPRDHDRDALYQLATDRLLQYQNALSDDDTRVAQGELPSLH
ncbi:MAG: cyclic nucleotide-binding domain-containing protein, partial [Vicinamibacterales bacterium]|nr:cyclic nucleotide-binding domain-containing protein [Vicinamibacterales bacterium]